MIQDIFKTDTSCTLGVDGIKNRYQLFKKFIEMNGVPFFVISSGAVVIKNVTDNMMVAGNPAVIKNHLRPLNF